MNVGVLVRPRVVEWQRQAIENVASVDGVNIAHVVVDASQRSENTTLSAGEEVVNQGSSISLSDFKLFMNVLRDDGLKSLLYADQKLGWLLFGEEQQLNYLQSMAVEDLTCLSDATITDIQPVSLEHPWKTLPDGITETLGEECDVVLRFGFGLLKGNILSAPKHGVLSAHASDIRDYRGMGPRITFLNNDTEVRVTLQQLNDDIDGGKILEISSKTLPECPALDDIYASAYDIQTTIFAEGVKKLQRGELPYRVDDIGDYYSHKRMKRDPLFVSRIILKNNIRRLKKIFRT